MIESRPDGYELRLSDFSVNRCVVDFGFTLHMARPLAAVRDRREQEEATLRIEGPFDYTADGVTYHCDTERDPRTAGPALALHQHAAEVAFVDTEGNLRLTFDNGATVWVPSDASYEAWTLAGSDGLLVVCGPGVVVSIFPSHRGPDSSHTQGPTHS